MQVLLAFQKSNSRPHGFVVPLPGGGMTAIAQKKERRKMVKNARREGMPVKETGLGAWPNQA
jgi:hypothetical protein